MKLRHIYGEGNKAIDFLGNLSMENTNRDVMFWTTPKRIEIFPTTRYHRRSMAEDGPL